MILVTGSLAFDQILDFPGSFSDHIMPEKIHKLNISFLVDKMNKSFGGTAGNIAFSLSLLKTPCAILGMVGSDFKPYFEFLKKNSIDVRFIQTENTSYTSMAFGITDRQDNQIWGFYTGADNQSYKLTIKKIMEKIDFGIIAPQNPRTMLKISLEYQKADIPYLFDPGMRLPHLKNTDLVSAFQGAGIIIGNDYEMEIIKKRLKLDDIAEISKKDKIVITTFGEKGSQIINKGRVYKIPPARPVAVKDPAGAGDAYRAGFIAGFIRKKPLQVCGQMGSLAAVFTVEKEGTTTHHYKIRDFCKRYQENFRQVLEV